MIEKKTFHFNLAVEIEIDSKRTSDEIVKEQILKAMDASFPRVICNEEALDLLLFTESFKFEVVDK